jgi:hypothetical protein
LHCCNARQVGHDENAIGKSADGPPGDTDITPPVRKLVALMIAGRVSVAAVERG